MVEVNHLCHSLSYPHFTTEVRVILSWSLASFSGFRACGALPSLLRASLRRGAWAKG